MVQQITSGIKISIETDFQGTFQKHNKLFYAFSYRVNIQNQSKDTVQLISRLWSIKDTLNDPETVVGEGVIGKKPVIAPGKSHSYTSGCVLHSSMGAMSGYYSMINFTTTTKFKVIIPSFKLNAPFAMN